MVAQGRKLTGEKHDAAGYYKERNSECEAHFRPVSLAGAVQARKEYLCDKECERYGVSETMEAGIKATPGVGDPPKRYQPPAKTIGPQQAQAHLKSAGLNQAAVRRITGV